MGWGEPGFKGPALMLLLYINTYGMQPWSLFSSQTLTIPAPWVILRVIWSIPVVSTLGDWVPFLEENREVKLNQPLSLHSYFSVISCLSTSPDPPAI